MSDSSQIPTLIEDLKAVANVAARPETLCTEWGGTTRSNAVNVGQLRDLVAAQARIIDVLAQEIIR